MERSGRGEVDGFCWWQMEGVCYKVSNGAAVGVSQKGAGERRDPFDESRRVDEDFFHADCGVVEDVYGVDVYREDSGFLAVLDASRWSEIHERRSEDRQKMNGNKEEKREEGEDEEAYERMGEAK